MLTVTTAPVERAARPRLLPRTQRRQVLLAGAARAFAQGGFAATSLEEVAAEAGVSRVLIYRHFDSKEQLYRQILDQTRELLAEATGASDQLGPSSLQALVQVAQEHPDEFGLFFRHAGREPAFRAHADELRAAMRSTTLPYLRSSLPNGRLRVWAAALVPAAVIEAILGRARGRLPETRAGGRHDWGRDRRHHRRDRPGRPRGRPMMFPAVSSDLPEVAIGGPRCPNRDLRTPMWSVH